MRDAVLFVWSSNVNLFMLNGDCSSFSFFFLFQNCMFVSSSFRFKLKAHFFFLWLNRFMAMILWSSTLRGSYNLTVDTHIYHLWNESITMAHDLSRSTKQPITLLIHASSSSKCYNFDFNPIECYCFSTHAFFKCCIVF